jgi:hypothetical protein
VHLSKSEDFESIDDELQTGKIQLKSSLNRDAGKERVGKRKN